MPKRYAPDERKKLNLDRDLEFHETHRHEISGARLYLTQTKAPFTDESGRHYNRCYVVFWAAPWQKNMKDYEIFSTKKAAKKEFNYEKRKGPPLTPSLQRDFQVSKVYRWEGDTLDKNSMNLSPEQMQRVVKKISEDFNMVAPKIKYKTPKSSQQNPASYYYTHLNKILMRHKKLSYVIHEVAHAVDHQVNGNKWVDHGPSFVRTLIRLAEKYQYWHCPEELEKSAKKAGILVAPEDSLPNLPKP
jgi:hypothetical protein